MYVLCVYIYMHVFDQAAMLRCGMWHLAAASGAAPIVPQQNGCQLTRFDFYNPRAACNAVKTNDKLKSIKLQLQRNGELNERSWGVVAGE